MDEKTWVLEAVCKPVIMCAHCLLSSLPCFASPLVWKMNMNLFLVARAKEEGLFGVGVVLWLEPRTCML